MAQNNDQKNILIKGDKDEVQQRISSFIAKKRNEIDTLNVREFCNISSDDVELENCARVDAVFVRRFGNKGHVKVSKAYNEWGPQTIYNRLRMYDPHSSSGNIEYSETSNKGLSHLKPVHPKVYERLKACEDDLLLLEKEKPNLFAN